MDSIRWDTPYFSVFCPNAGKSRSLGVVLRGFCTSFFRQYFLFLLFFFLWTYIKVKKLKQILMEKKTKIIIRPIYAANLFWPMLKKPNLPEKLDYILKKRGTFIGICFRHFMSLYGQKSLKSYVFLVLNWIDAVFWFMPLL